MAHAIALSNAESAAVCSLEYEALLSSEREAMVGGIDAVLSDAVVRDLPSLMRQSVLPTFDDGDLESLTDAMAESLQLLAEDEVALQGFSDLLHTETILQDDHLLEIARALAVDPRLTEGVGAFAGLSTLPDRDGFALDSLLYAASRALAYDPSSPSCTGLADQHATENLLSTDGFGDAAVPGQAALVSRVDAEGELTGEIYDVKQTAWGHGLRLAGEAVEAGAVTDMALVLDAALGPAVPCAAGEHPNCYRYSSQDNPIYQLLYAGLEVARFDRPVAFLETWSQLVQDDPELAEQVLVSLGQIIKAVGDSDFDATSPEVYELVEEFLPVVASIFRINTSAGAMPRLLMEVVHDLSTTAREFPDKLLISIEHTRLIKPNECSAELPDANSPEVDFSRRRYYFAGGSLVDNRSTLEQSIELLAAADCGTVPFTGGMSVGEAIVDLMSRLAPDTVCNLIDNLLGLLGFTGSVGEALVNTTLSVVGCNGANDVRASDLFALDDLAKSGALDFYLPIAKTFREEGELPALLRVFDVMARDLRSDEDADANSKSALRPILPILAELLRAGAVDPFFDLNDKLVTVSAVDGDGTLADVVVDSADRLLDDTGTINTASGPQAGRSLAEELISAALQVATRVEDADQRAAAGRLFDHGSAYLTETYLDDQGTADSADDRLRLQDPSIVPLVSSLLKSATQASRLPSAQYQCYLEDWQLQSKSWVRSPALAAVLSVGVLLDSYEGRAEIETMVAGLLDPERTDTEVAPFDEILRMSAEVLQSPVSIGGLQAVADYLSTRLYPSPQGKILVTTLARVLENDSTRVLQRLLANGLGPSGSEAESAPFYQLATLAEDYAAIDSDNQCIAGDPIPDSPEELKLSLLSLVGFLQDEDSVLTGVYDLLRKRSGP
jgi:hypothetical protein